MKGSYVLVIEVLDDLEIEVGRLGRIDFGKGFYMYVGSAMNNLEKRIRRHLREEKKRFWHIDYLLEHAEIKEVVCFESEKKQECVLAEYLKESFDSIKGFGCSDCSCKSHLFFSDNIEEISATLLKARHNI